MKVALFCQTRIRNLIQLVLASTKKVHYYIRFFKLYIIPVLIKILQLILSVLEFEGIYLYDFITFFLGLIIFSNVL